MTGGRPSGGSALDRIHRGALRVAYSMLRTYWWIRRPVTTGVQVAVWHDDRLLIIRNSYRTELGVPGGGMRRGEETAAAAQRELREEAGVDLAIEQLRYFGVVESRHDHVLDHCHFFEVSVAAEPDVTIDHREVVWAGFISPSDLADASLHAPVRDYLRERVRREGNHVEEA